LVVSDLDSRYFVPMLRSLFTVVSVNKQFH
jgi:hypothetical protein